jgi:hypothetical protein
MKSKESRLYAIAVIGARQMRDFKLGRLQGDTAPPNYSMLLRVYSGACTLIEVPEYQCRLTGGKFRHKIFSCTRWKTLSGCTNAIARIEASASSRRSIDRRLDGNQYQLVAMDITECWVGTVMYQISLEKRAFAKRVEMLEKKLDGLPHPGRVDI